MTKKKTKKGGFTLVELVIVILVIAILAAILIPTFVSLTKKAKMSADEQIVAGINIALTAEEISNGKPSTIEAVNIILTENGYRAPISPSSSDHEFYWIAADNRVVLVKMNGETPESIVYPKELAAKYKLVLPANGEWFKLGDAGCEHTDIEYGALADEDGGSTNHIGVCKICNNVVVEKEAHDTKGEGGACSKCGWIASGEHTHAYTYTSDNAGHHKKECSCGELVLEACLYDASGKCAYCGYVKPSSGEHAHNFTYTSNNDGTHTIACNASDCPGFGETTANCAYDAKTGKCVFCGYSKPDCTHEWEYVGNAEKHYRRCTKCGATEAEAAHTMSEWTTVNEPSCTTTGLQRRICSVCGWVEVEELPVAHNYIYFKTENPYATKHKYLCLNCGDCCKKNDEVMCNDNCGDHLAIPCTSGSLNPEDHVYNGHSLLVYDPDGDVDPTHWGNTPYDDTYHAMRCVICDGLGATESIKMEHDTNGEGGACSVCGYKAHDHVVTDWTIDTPATCTTTGKKHGACTVEGCTVIVKETIPATGHTVTIGECIDMFNHSGTCANCDTKTFAHEFVNEQTIGGKQYYVCGCGAMLEIPNGLPEGATIKDLTGRGFNSTDWGHSVAEIGGNKYKVWKATCNAGPANGTEFVWYTPVNE